MKNIFYLILLGLVALALTACTDDDDVEENTNDTGGMTQSLKKPEAAI